MKRLKQMVAITALVTLLGTAGTARAGGLIGMSGKQKLSTPGKAFSKGASSPSLLQVLLPVAALVAVLAYFSGGDDNDAGHG